MTDDDMQLVAGAFAGLPAEVKDRNIERASKVVSHLNRSSDELVAAGNELLAAKEELKGTRGAFGEWREKYMPEVSASMASRLINVAQKFGGDDHFCKFAKMKPSILMYLSQPSTSATDGEIEMLVDADPRTAKEADELLEAARAEGIEAGRQQGIQEAAVVSDEVIATVHENDALKQKLEEAKGDAEYWRDKRGTELEAAEIKAKAIEEAIESSSKKLKKLQKEESETRTRVHNQQQAEDSITSSKGDARAALLALRADVAGLILMSEGGGLMHLLKYEETARALEGEIHRGREALDKIESRLFSGGKPSLDNFIDGDIVN